MDMLYDMIQYNYLPIIIAGCLLVFIISNTVFEKQINQKFILATFFSLSLTIVDCIRIWAKSLPYPTGWRIFCSAFGYSVRPMIILCILLLVIKRQYKRRIYYVPAVMNVVVSFSAFFTDIAFGFDAKNEFVRGPLGYIPHMVSWIYAVLLLYFTFRFFKDKDFREGAIVMSIIVFSSIATFMESYYEFQSVLNGTIAVSIAYYYLYFNTQSFKRDPLTGIWNRKMFLIDSYRYKDQITAVLALDLNNLKEINDYQGHSAGDTAIVSVTRCIKECLPFSYRFYRIGGDEFMILCLREKEVRVRAVVQDIKSKVAQTPYSCAIGLAYRTEQDNIDSLCTKADEAMYKDKIEMKQKYGYTIR